MSAIVLLMGLLVLSFLGSLLVGRGTARGLPSGLEYVGLGFAVGPQALGFVEHQMIVEFEPMVQVGLGWLAFVIGLDFGRVDGRRVRVGSMALGVSCALLTGAIVFVAAHQMLTTVKVAGIGRENTLIFAAAAGAVGAETTRHAVQWVGLRWGARGRVSKLLAELASSDDIGPLVAAGAIFSLVPAPGLTLTLPASGWFTVSVALGALLGTVTALLLRGVEGDAVWGALLGTMLLGVGIATRFGLCTIFVTFVMGIALAAISPARRALRRLVGATERAVLYPMLLLAGARLEPKALIENKMLGALVALVLLARIFGKLLSGLIVRLSTRAAQPAGGALGIVMLSSGPVTMCCAFVFALRFPGTLGDTLLVCAVASAIVGELVSTVALKRLLVHVGEVVAESPVSTKEPAT